MTAAFRKRLLDAATAPYRPAGRFAWHFARGKLSRDPVFFTLLREGMLPAECHIVNLGCGQALLSNLITAAQRLHRAGDWPADWPTPPVLRSYRGIELMEKDVARAQPALPAAAEVVKGDIRHTEFGEANVAIILDSLHYIDTAAQDAVLTRVRDTLRPDGTLLMRVGDAAAGLPFRLCMWVDRTVTFVRGHRLGQLYCRPVADWRARLEELGFSVRTMPMDAGTPFANTLLACRLEGAGRTQAAP